MLLCSESYREWNKDFVRKEEEGCKWAKVNTVRRGKVDSTVNVIL